MNHMTVGEDKTIGCEDKPRSAPAYLAPGSPVSSCALFTHFQFDNRRTYFFGGGDHRMGVRIKDVLILRYAFHGCVSGCGIEIGSGEVS